MLQKKSSNNSLKETTNTQLSIQFSLDGFSFCVQHLDTQETLFFCEYQFEKTQKTPEELLLKIEEIFKMDINLQRDFSSVTVIHQNNLATLVPDVFFDEKHLKSYLDFNVKTLATDFISFDSIANIASKNVYIPYVNINNYLFQNFGKFEYKHHTSILIDKLIEKTLHNEKQVFINVSKNTFDVIVLENNQLLLSNTFNFNTKEDFIYYILFIAEQLQLDTEIFPLFFLGEIDIQTEIYKITYQYVRNVSFLENSNPIFATLDTLKHTHFILLG